MALAGWAPGQLLACTVHRNARPAGGGADVGDRREQGVLPKVVGRLPGDLIKQGQRVGPAGPYQYSGSGARWRNTSRGRCCPAGAAARARSAAGRCRRRGPARRAESGERSRCPREWAAFWQAYHDAKAESPVAGQPYQRMPAADRCSPATATAVTVRRCLLRCVTHVNCRSARLRRAGHPNAGECR